MRIVHAADWDLPDFNQAIVRACNDGEHEVSITRLAVGESVHTGYPDAHGDLQLDASGRYYIVPSREKQLVIAWEIKGFEFVEAADLQIYSRDGDPLSFVQITEGRGTHETYGEPEGRRGAAQDGFTFASGPYLVRLRITRVRASTKVVNKARRLYFDVLPIVVIGGGIAGIRTAGRLLEADSSASVVILEARDYLGGRAHTIPWEGLAVDLGCQFLQDAPTNPLVGLAATHGHPVFWHKQVTAVRVPMDGAIIDDDDERWKAADGNATASDSTADESLQEALSRKARARCEDQVREEHNDAVAEQTSAEVERQAQLLAVDHDFTHQYPLDVQQSLLEGQAQLVPKREELAEVEMQLHRNDTEEVLLEERAKTALGRRQQQLRVQVASKERSVNSLQQESVTLEGGEPPAKQKVLLTAARTRVKKERETEIKTGFQALREETFDDDVQERVQALLEDRLFRLAVAFTAELDEGSEATTFTSYEEPEPDDGDDVEGEGGDGNGVGSDGVESSDEASDHGEEHGDDVGTSNKMSTEGYGALIDAYATELRDEHPENLTVLLEHAVSRVEVAQPIVKVTTAQGMLHACGVVVTVPTEIMRRSLITFLPALPDPIIKAFELLPMGHYKKIFLPLKAHSAVTEALTALVEGDDELAEGETDASVFTITAAGVPWKFLYRISLNVVVAFVGGQPALALDGQSDAAVAREALAVLAAALDMTADAVSESWTEKVLTSKWSTDPWSHGAYSYTRPGGGVAARKTLREALLHGRIVFAGEAVRSSKEEYATAHGAWLSGEDAASLILEALE